MLKSVNKNLWTDEIFGESFICAAGCCIKLSIGVSKAANISDLEEDKTN